MSDGSFSLQRIHYFGISHGPRQWSDGVIEGNRDGSIVKIAYRLRAATLLTLLFWGLVVIGLAAFGLSLGFGDRTPVFLAGVAVILLIGAAFLVIGVRMERRLCTQAFRSIFKVAE